jgi:hypothetical protein
MAGMFRTRFWLAMAVLVLTLGPLLATAGYGLYLRSGLHANALAQRASIFLGAPVQIGGIVPLDNVSRGFRDVQVWLPGEFSPIFTCKTAILRQIDSQSMELDLREGRIEARTDEWNRTTLGQLLATALAHDFRHIRLKTVRLENMDLVVRRGRAAVWINGASGQMDLSGEVGRIDLVCDGLNGVQPAEPIRIHCEFEPGEEPLVRELSASVQRLGIEAFAGRAGRGPRGADRTATTTRKTQIVAQEETATAATTATANPQITQISQIGINSNNSKGPAEAGTTNGVAGVRSPVTAERGGRGWFTGRIVYQQRTRESLAGVVTLSGNFGEVDLAALGPPAGKTKLAGIISGTLDRAVLEDGRLQALQGRLRIADLDLKGLLELAGLPAAQGSATLDLHELRYEAGKVQALLAQAQVRDLDVEPLVQPLRVGSIRGRLNATLQKLKIVDGRLDELAGEARLAPPAGTVGTIDRSILEAAIQRLCNISLPPILAEQVPYTELAARFHGDGDDLYIEGAAGPQEKFVLVVDMGSVPLPLVPAPPEPIAMGPLREQVKGQASRLGRLAAEWARQKMGAQE